MTRDAASNQLYSALSRRSMSPKVSIVIPTYNYGCYIEAAINSVLNQRYKNIEILVVDDGSTDDTQSRLEQYQNDSRLNVIVQSNQGAAAARNRGIKASTGAFIAFLDADDIYRPDNIAVKVSFLTAHQEFAWCYSNWAWVDKEGRTIRFGNEPDMSLAHLRANGNILHWVLQGYKLQTNVFLFRRETLDAVGGFDESLTVLEDHDLYLRTAADFPIGYVDDVLLEIYQHADSLGTGVERKTAYYCRWLLHRKIVRFYPKQLQTARIAPAWRYQQADLYRNLAELAYAQGQYQRAIVLLRASMHARVWQPGAFLLWFRILWQHWRSGGKL